MCGTLWKVCARSARARAGLVWPAAVMVLMTALVPARQDAGRHRHAPRKCHRFQRRRCTGRDGHRARRRDEYGPVQAVTNESGYYIFEPAERHLYG